MKDWSLELEEVFALDRDGELNKYSKYKNNLHNKMLLWHGKIFSFEKRRKTSFLSSVCNCSQSVFLQGKRTFCRQLLLLTAVC
jgi:predicted sulfurtransferase